MSKPFVLAAALVLAGRAAMGQSGSSAGAMDIWAPPGGALIDMGEGRLEVPPSSSDTDAFTSVLDRVKEITQVEAGDEKREQGRVREPAGAAPGDEGTAAGSGAPRASALTQAANAADAAAMPAANSAEPARPAMTIAAPAGKDKGPNVATQSVLQEPLPGVSHMRGAKGLPAPVQPPTPLVFDVTDGITEVVTVSNSMPNRIATPFRKPVAVDSSGAEIEYVGNNVYILPASEEPFGVFISDESGGAVAALTLVPRSIPSQNIILQVDRSRALSGVEDSEARRRSRPDSHTDNLVKMLRDIVANRTPGGFTLARLNVGEARVGPTRMTPDRRWTGPDVDVYRYLLRNTSGAHVELTESSFYEEGVKAVAFFPHVRLSPNETTFAFIVTEGRGPDPTGTGPGAMRFGKRR